MNKDYLEKINTLILGSNKHLLDPSELPQDYIQEISKNPLGWVRAYYKFTNGYGASVISLGDVWELAILDANDAVCYNTSIADGVERGDASRIAELLQQIEGL